jgi:hypothetical protein
METDVPDRWRLRGIAAAARKIAAVLRLSQTQLWSTP